MMATKRLYAKADITEWRDEAFQDELVPKDKEEILRAIEDGMHTAKVARATIVSRELKEAPEDIIRENKVLMQVGAMQDISQIVARQKSEIQTKSGETWQVPAFVGDQDDGDGQSYYPSDSYKAKDIAERYLQNQVVGHIRNRLATIFQGGGDVSEVATWLKVKIDELVDELTAP
jgi:hypothetical protein